MPRGPSKMKKNKFDDLPQDWKDALESSSLDELKSKVAEVAKTEFLNQSEMKADQDLNEKKELVKVASAGYREVTKLNKLKLSYLTQMMADKGDAMSQQTVQNLMNANGGA